MTLDDARQALDRMDDKLVRVFLERMQISEAVGKIKAGTGQAVYAEQREEEILERIKEKAAALLGPEDRSEPATHMRSLMRHILQISREYQYDLLMPQDAGWELGRRIRNAPSALASAASVAVQGGIGSYQSLAAKWLYPNAEQIEVLTWEDSCRMAQEGTVDLAVLPLENTTAGPVDKVYDLLLQHDLYVVASCALPISHCLMASPGTSLSQIETVVSIPQALAQCAETIRQRGWRGIASDNTAYAAREVAMNGDSVTAAIGSAEAARVYGLDVLLEDLNDMSSNQTRFVVVARDPVIADDADRVSLILHLADRSGTLSSALNIFADRGLNLQKIQSRPMPDKPWEYSFYLDFCAKACTQEKEQALVTLYQLAREHTYVRFLGWYREYEKREDST